MADTNIKRDKQINNNSDEEQSQNEEVFEEINNYKSKLQIII